jgi:hypothetical protein
MAEDAKKQHSEATTDTTGKPEGPENLSSRRKFVTGMATALGAAAVVAVTSGKSESKESINAEKSATDVRSRIVSRIQEELKRSGSDQLFAYEKSDSGGYGKYIKADDPPFILQE